MNCTIRGLLVYSRVDNSVTSLRDSSPNNPVLVKGTWLAHKGHLRNWITDEQVASYSGAPHLLTLNGDLLVELEGDAILSTGERLMWIDR